MSSRISLRERRFRLRKSHAASDKQGLLGRRAAALGLDLPNSECCDRKTFDKLQKRCAACAVRMTCAADLKHNRYDPKWRAYCRNAAVLMTLAEAWWPRIYPGTWSGREARFDREVE